jgi:hypothetical protein
MHFARINSEHFPNQVISHTVQNLCCLFFVCLGCGLGVCPLTDSPLSLTPADIKWSGGALRASGAKWCRSGQVFIAFTLPRSYKSTGPKKQSNDLCQTPKASDSTVRQTTRCPAIPNNMPQDHRSESLFPYRSLIILNLSRRNIQLSYAIYLHR